MIQSETFLRVEEKFRLSSAQAEQFMIAARDHLTPDIYPEYDLNTIYYDTPNFDLINHCLNHPLYRLKLRLRSYGNPAVGAPVFLETKQRLGDWGEKRRVALTYNEQFSCALKPDDLPRDGQIAGELRQVLETYAVEPKVFIAYHRMAFVADNDLRITLDTRIRSRMKNVNLVLDGTEVPLASAPEVLMEVKLAGPYPFWLSSILSSLHVYPDSFSKYGSIYTSYVKNMYRNYVLENESAPAGEASVCLRPF